MELKIVAVPLFDQEMTVQAYYFHYQKGNDLFSVTQATNMFDGASRSLPLETLNVVGVDAFTLGKPIFVPINHIMLLGNLHDQCRQPPESIIFFLEGNIPPEDIYLNKMLSLKNLGYRFAFDAQEPLEDYTALYQQVDYVFLSQQDGNTEQSARLLPLLRRQYPNLNLVATKIPNETACKNLYGKGFLLYESQFYRVPVTKGKSEISPLKVNSLRLINTVQDENFEFEKITRIVQGDPALTLSLLELVNSLRISNKISTINHAVAMLGQQEVRKWVTTAVSRIMGKDRPNEITRISLVRARFAENLAPMFEMVLYSQSLFLMGLFSMLDVILEQPMEDAVARILISDEIKSALVEGTGRFYPVLDLITDYENADWQAVSRHIIIHDIHEEDLYDAYISALIWYQTLVSMESPPSPPLA